MADPLSLTAAINNASKVANTPLFTTIIDKLTGFKISNWAAEGELRKKILHDEYEKAKETGISGVQYIENLRHTTNLIDTAVKSSKYIKQDKTNDIKIDNDFFWNLLEHSKTVSNDEVQELIAKIIASEYNEPESYSMSTLHMLKMLGRKELELFERIGSLLVNKAQLPGLLYSFDTEASEFTQKFNVDFEALQTLQTLGLFLPNEMISRTKNPLINKYQLLYFDRKILFESINKNKLDIEIQSFYSLSTTGSQIMQHLNPQFDDEYFQWLKENYKIPNYKLFEDKQ